MSDDEVDCLMFKKLNSTTTTTTTTTTPATTANAGSQRVGQQEVGRNESNSSSNTTAAAPAGQLAAKRPAKLRTKRTSSPHLEPTIGARPMVRSRNSLAQSRSTSGLVARRNDFNHDDDDHDDGRHYHQQQRHLDGASATSTSEVNSSDDAVSIASRLSQLVVEQEGKLMGGPARQTATRSPVSQGLETRGGRQVARCPGNTARRSSLDQPATTDTFGPDPAAQEERVPAIQVISCCQDDQQPQTQSPVRSRTKSVGVGQASQGWPPPPPPTQDGDCSRQCQDVETNSRPRGQSQHNQIPLRRNESTGCFSPERGDLRSLDALRLNQSQSNLMRMRSNTAGNVDLNGQLMLNICRSAWTLSDFEQTFKDSDNGSEKELIEGNEQQQQQQQLGPNGGQGYGSNSTSANRDTCLLIKASKNALNMSYSSQQQQPQTISSTAAATMVPRDSQVFSSPAYNGRRPSQMIQQQQQYLGADSQSTGGAGHRRASINSFSSSCDSFRIGGGGGLLNGVRRATGAAKLGGSQAAGQPWEQQAGYWSSCCNLATLKQCLPVLDWLPAYKLDYLWGDLTAGLAVAVLNISTSLSAAVVAETDLAVAFRSSIVNTLVYALLCSSRHTSFGSWSIMSQMLLISVRRALSDELILNRINLGPSASWEPHEYEQWHMHIIIMYTFLIGLVQLVSGLLNLGNILASFIPGPLCSSMIAATAFTMAVGQLANMCGTTNKVLWAIEKNTTELWADLKNPPLDITDLFAGLFRWIKQIALLAKYYEQINLVCVLISLVSLLFLAWNQYFLQVKLKQWLGRNILVPSELLLLVLMILVSYWLELGPKYQVATCGPIYIDFGAPSLPNLRLFRELWFDSLATALISFTMVFIMAKTYSNRFNYEIDCNQELIACGAGNLIGGLFDALPATASFSRTAGQVEAGGRTQMASLINCGLLVALARLLGHHVAVLPVCVMSATLFYGFVRMMARSREALFYWRICKVDFAIWLVTCAAILTLDMVNGFLYGFIFSILTMLYRAQNRRCYLLGGVHGTSDVYVPLAKYPLAREIDGIKIFQFCGPIHYVCADLFERLLRQKTRVNVKQLLRSRANTTDCGSNRCQQQQQQLAPADQLGSKRGSCATVSAWDQAANKLQQPSLVGSMGSPATVGHGQMFEPPSGGSNLGAGSRPLPTHIILDFSMISFIDSAGISVLKKIIEDYQQVGVTILFASLASHVAAVVKSEPSLWEAHKDRFYVTLADAVHCAMRDSQQQQHQQLSRQASSIQMAHSHLARPANNNNNNL